MVLMIVLMMMSSIVFGLLEVGTPSFGDGKADEELTTLPFRRMSGARGNHWSNEEDEEASTLPLCALCKMVGYWMASSRGNSAPNRTSEISNESTRDVNSSESPFHLADAPFVLPVRG